MTFVWWHWVALGVILIGAELALPGLVLLWFGIGALLVGVLLTLAPELALSWQIAIFAATSVLATLLSRLWLRRFGGSGGAPSLNRPDEGLAGRVFRLDAPIEFGSGHLWIGDVRWRIVGPDLPAGKKVRVVAWDKVAAALTVEPAVTETPTQSKTGLSDGTP
ncbi:NfeD family protein [Algihabitans albus]|uniref:NfeD family protein n=1 Tax=Algihabitans albus TaxID=2164067 RepID=UPI000E5CB485|nr:NfeD family protein [Algihabitans albus]